MVVALLIPTDQSADTTLDDDKPTIPEGVHVTF